MRRPRRLGACSDDEPAVTGYAVAGDLDQPATLLLIEQRRFAGRAGDDDAGHPRVEVGANVLGECRAIDLARRRKGRHDGSHYTLERKTHVNTPRACRRDCAMALRAQIVASCRETGPAHAPRSDREKPVTRAASRAPIEAATAGYRTPVVPPERRRARRHECRRRAVSR